MPRRAPEDLIPVTVLTGFLGSGKTTVLSHLLGQPAFANTAVVINEFGEISLDHVLVRKTSEDIVELQGGCLCCTARGDLLGALQDLFRRRKHGMVPPFERVVVETTGLADPAPILHTLMRDRLIVAVYRLDGVVATVDCVNGANTLDAHGESVKQAAVADRLLLTKSDLAEPAAV
ncbi:MAG: GTP-binding protein, partial [Rhodospirillales bacterium]|nr:GTP-binding protein [Rhodospirillales bacterium]